MTSETFLRLNTDFISKIIVLTRAAGDRYPGLMKQAPAPSAAPTQSAPSARTPRPAGSAAAAGGGAALKTLSYAQGRAATSPDGAGLPADPGTLPYQHARTLLSPEAAPASAAAAEADAPAAAPADSGADAEQARVAAAAASYQQRLGEVLGAKLFALVSKELSTPKLLALASRGLAALVDAGVGQIAPVEGVAAMDTAAEAEAVKQFAAAMGEWAKGAAGEWLAGPEGAALAGKVGAVAQGNPELVVAGALLAALAAVAGNAPIPKLAGSRQIGDSLTVSAGVEVGRLRQIAVQAAELGVQVKKGDLEAGLRWSMTKGEGGAPDQHKLAGKIANATTSLSGDLSVQGDNVVIKADAAHQGDGYQVAGGVQHSRGGGAAPTTLANATVSIGGQDKNLTANASYDAASGELSLAADAVRDFGDGVQAQGGVAHKTGPDGAATTATGKLAYDKDGTSASASVAADLSGGSATADLAARRQFAKGSIAGNLSVDAQGGVSGGVQAEAELEAGLKLKLGALLQQDGVAKAALSAEQQFGDFFAQGSAELNLSTSQLEKLALHLGYQDKDKLRSAVLDYKRSYDGDVPLEQFDVQLSAAIDRLTLRASDTSVLRDGKLASNLAHLEGGYRINDDVTAIAGLRHGTEGAQGLGSLADRDRGTWLEAGVQVKGVPLVLGVRPEDGAVSVGVTIPF